MVEPIRPMTLDEAYPGRFMRAGHLGDKPRTLTIADVVLEDLEGENGSERKVIVTFAERSRTSGQPWQLVLAKINALALAAMFGRSVKAWIGKRVVLFATDQIAPLPTAKGDDRFCIRVYGSPDLTSDLSFEWKAPRRKALHLTLRATAKGDATHEPG